MAAVSTSEAISAAAAIPTAISWLQYKYEQIISLYMINIVCWMYKLYQYLQWEMWTGRI